MFSIDRKFPALVILIVFAVPFWLQAEPTLDTRDFGEHDDPRMVAGIERHDRGVEGSESAVDEAIEMLESILKDSPDNALARAYLGSAYTVKARDVALWNKRRWAERGGETLDEAVARAPANPRVRLVRAINSYNLPRMLGRYGVAEEDFAFLLGAIDTSPDDLGDELIRAVYFHAGAFALKERENARALVLLEKAEAVEGESPIAEQIGTMLRLARERNS